jgi:hypothetical protein
MYAYIQMIVLSYSWQVERWLFKASTKISKNAICHFLLLFIGVKSGIPQEGHLEPKEMKIYQTFLFSVKAISFEKANCVDIVTNMYGHCYIHRTILAKSQNQINKSCAIYLQSLQHYLSISCLFRFIQIWKMVRNDKTLLAKLSYNINFRTCAIYPLYNSIDKTRKHSLVILSLFCLFIFEMSFVFSVSKWYL